MAVHKLPLLPSGFFSLCSSARPVRQSPLANLFPKTKDVLLAFILHSANPNAAKMPKGSGLTKPMKLSPELAAIVGKKEASRAECVKQLWAYIKKHNLQDPENRQFFKPDATMAKVFGKDKLRAFSMSKYIGAHLS